MQENIEEKIEEKIGEKIEEVKEENKNTEDSKKEEEKEREGEKEKGKEEEKSESKKYNENKKYNHEDERILSALAYLLFFLPLFAIPNSKSGKFHANQGLNLLIVYVFGNVLFSIIPIVGWIVLPLFYLFIFILFIIGFTNALNKKEKVLPVIGEWFDFIK